MGAGGSYPLAGASELVRRGSSPVATRLRNRTSDRVGVGHWAELAGPVRLARPRGQGSSPFFMPFSFLKNFLLFSNFFVFLFVTIDVSFINYKISS